VSNVFNGAGTKWVGELSDPEHKYNKHFESVKDEVEGACAYCARAFGVPSLAKLVSEGYQVITF